MHKHRFSSILPFLAIIAMILVACGGNETAGNTTNAPASGAAVEATSAPAAGGEAATSAPAAGGEATSAPAASGASGEPVTITWGFWGSPEEQASHEKVAQAFMESHPNIKVEIWHQPWDDYFTKLKTLWASGDASQIPDVLFLWPTPSYAATGVLEDLTPYIQKSNYNLDNYWPNLLESAKYNDKVYGFPRDIETNVLYYNKDVFDQAGVPYPTNDWTWEDLRNAAQKLSVVEGSGRVTRYGLAAEGGKWTKFVVQNGGSILDDMRNPSKCTLTDPKSVEGIQFFAGLMNDKLAMRPADLSQAGGDAAVFQNGQAAMIIQNSSRVPTFNEAGLKYDVAPAPMPQSGQRANAAGGAAWVMSAKSDNKDAAWTFLEWLQSPDGGQLIYTKNGDIFPALQPVATSDVFLKQEAPPQNRQAFITEAENAKVGFFGYFPEWDELAGTIISPGLEQIWAGQVQPEQGLQQICTQVDAFLKDKGYPKSQ